MRLITTTFLIILLFIANSSNGQVERLNTKTLAEGQDSPKAKISDIAWMQGHWVGEAFGGETTEIWSPPAAGAMMCSFSLINEGEVNFYEFVIIREQEGTLLVQIKHFDSELDGWEEKDESVDFPLVEITKDAVYFDGLTYKKDGPNKMTAFVIINEGDGKVEEVAFPFKRIGS